MVVSVVEWEEWFLCSLQHSRHSSCGLLCVDAWISQIRFQISVQSFVRGWQHSFSVQIQTEKVQELETEAKRTANTTT
eukprot:scaffold301518_cov109-Cyclotella_meneghiniana.AAC.1